MQHGIYGESKTAALFGRQYVFLNRKKQENAQEELGRELCAAYLPLINEDRFSVFYSSNQASRPNTPVNVIIGLLLLKEMFGSTDEELMETVLFDVRYQYALHTTSFAEQPVSDRTLSRFRERLYVYEQETDIAFDNDINILGAIYLQFMECI